MKSGRVLKNKLKKKNKKLKKPDSVLRFQCEFSQPREKKKPNSSFLGGFDAWKTWKHI